jgi:hypothetical protein
MESGKQNAEERQKLSSSVTEKRFLDACTEGGGNEKHIALPSATNGE